MLAVALDSERGKESKIARIVFDCFCQWMFCDGSVYGKNHVRRRCQCSRHVVCPIHHVGNHDGDIAFCFSSRHSVATKATASRLIVTWFCWHHHLFAHVLHRHTRHRHQPCHRHFLLQPRHGGSCIMGDLQKETFEEHRVRADLHHGWRWHYHGRNWRR